MPENHYAIPLLRFQFQFAHQWLDDTLHGVTDELAHWQPEGKLHPIGAEYVHIVTTEDFMIQNLLQRTAPLMATTYADKAGFSEPPPQGNRDVWAKALKVDLGTLHGYAQAVYAATDTYLASISDPDLEKPLDVTPVGFGMQSVRFVLNLLILNIYSHSGEISCLKGLNGLQGYPGQASPKEEKKPMRFSSNQQQASADETVLRPSLDAKATLNISPFSRRGQTRVHLATADHDFKPTESLAPYGIFLPSLDEFYLYFTPSKVTADFIGDCLRDFWITVCASFPLVTPLLLNHDNAPDNHSRRTQFMARLTAFADEFGLTLQLAYYPPYHSKYNPIERAFWSTIGTALYWILVKPFSALLPP